MTIAGKIFSSFVVTVIGGVVVALITMHLSHGPAIPTASAGGASGTIAANYVPIPLSAACEWAYPGQATGKTSGGGYNIICVDANGNSLGGFPDNSGHSLNDWCASPDHTDGMDLRQADLTASGWVCAPVQ
jgi:hypothetical protein